MHFKTVDLQTFSSNRIKDEVKRLVSVSHLGFELLITVLYCRCWLSMSSGLIWTFIAPVLTVVLVGFSLFCYLFIFNF